MNTLRLSAALLLTTTLTSLAASQPAAQPQPNPNTRKQEGLRYISRGLWVRDGQLLALASLDEASGFFGPSLELRAFRWNPTSEKNGTAPAWCSRTRSTTSRRSASPRASGP